MRLVKTCLQVSGWSGWAVNPSSCWPVLDRVQDQVGHCCFSLQPPNTAEDFPSKPGLVYGFGWKPQANRVKSLDSAPNQAKCICFCFILLGDDWEREENLHGSSVDVSP